MRRMVAVIVVLLVGVAGCGQSRRFVFSTDSVECQRLTRIMRNMEEDAPGDEKVQAIALFGEDPNEPFDEVSLEDFKLAMFWIVGCCCPQPHPLASEWIEYRRLDCIRRNLYGEEVRRIAIYEPPLRGPDKARERPEDWIGPWAEITDPERIGEVLRLVNRAMDTEEDRFSNEIEPTMPMQIITDKHKFIIPVVDYQNAIRGIGWTSYELKRKLKQWGFHSR